MSKLDLEKAYSNPEKVPWHDTEIPKEITEIASKIKPCKVLDIGCGTGVHAIFLSKIGFDVLGIDISKKAIDYCRNQARKQKVTARFEVISAENLNLIKEKFDLILEWGVLHFIPFKKRKNYIKSIANHLNSKGKYLSLSFNDKSPEWGGGKIRKGITGSQIYYSSRSELGDLFKPYFKILELKERKTHFKNSGNTHLHNYFFMEKI